MKYKSTYRFSILCLIDRKILEVPPGKVIECTNPINHKYMKLVEEEKPVEKTYKKRRSKKLNTLDEENLDGDNARSIT